MVTHSCGSPKVPVGQCQTSLLSKESSASQGLRVAQGGWGGREGPAPPEVGSQLGRLGVQPGWSPPCGPSWAGKLTQGWRLSVEVCMPWGWGSRASRCLMAAPHLSGIQ